MAGKTLFSELQGGDRLSGYEAYRKITLYIQDEYIETISVNPAQELTDISNLDELKPVGGDTFEIEVPPHKLEGAITLTEQYNMITELSFNMRIDFVTATIKSSVEKDIDTGKKDKSGKKIMSRETFTNQSEVYNNLDQIDDLYYPLIDPTMINKLRVRAELGYKALPGQLKTFYGLLTTLNPAFQADGRITCSFSFYDQAFDMGHVGRYFVYPSLLDPVSNKAIDKNKQVESDITGEDLIKTKDQAEQESESSKTFFDERLKNIRNRPWAKRKKGESISLYEIFKGIVEGIDFNGQKVGGYNYTLTMSDDVKKELETETYTLERPLSQDGKTDWLFLKSQCEGKTKKENKRSITMRKNTSFSKLSVELDFSGNLRKKSADPEFKFVLYRPGHRRVDFNPFQIDSDADIPAILDNSFEENERKVVKGTRNFVVKGGLNISVNATGYFAPMVRSFVNDKGEEIVITQPKNNTTSEIFYSVNQKAIRKVSIEKTQEVLGQGVSVSIDQFIDFKDQGWIADNRVFYNSNDTTEKGYKTYPPRGWESSFETVGNPYVLVGNWYYINGIGVNYAQMWEMKRITHTFDHKWTTAYTMER